MKRLCFSASFAGVLCLAAGVLAADRRAVNYDEAKAGVYSLPDPLAMADGTPVTDAAMWRTKRRPELLSLFRAHVYGHGPARPEALRFELRSTDALALGGLATRKEIRIHFTGEIDGPRMDLLLYVPNARKGPAAAFLGLNFYGNTSVCNDPGIAMPTNWMRANKECAIADHRATEATRGTHASRWQVEKVLRRGYALATAYYGDLEPDRPEGWREGIRASTRPGHSPGIRLPAGDVPRGAPEDAALDDWGAIGAWAWGLSRALDYLATDADVDAGRVAVLGHSRLGKTALWAGAQDERFAMVISTQSGEGGAALARRDFGETIAIITRSFPHWFCDRYDTYAGRADRLPVDQHELIALMAPRPVYVASAEEDRWCDPLGEFLAAKSAEPVYAILGKPGLGVGRQPPVDHPVGAFIGYHVRTGVHSVTEYDWEQYLAFADRHFKAVPPAAR